MISDVMVIAFRSLQNKLNGGKWFNFFLHMIYITLHFITISGRLVTAEIIKTRDASYEV